MRHMLDEGDPAELGGPAAGGHAALAERGIAHRLYRLASSLGAADMRHLDALHTHVQQPQDEGWVEAGCANNRGDRNTLGRDDRELYIVQIVGGVLHVDEGGIEARQPDDLDDLRVGDPADMGAQREPAIAQYPFYPILFHASPPVVGNHIEIGRRVSARAITRPYSCGTLQARQSGEAASRPA